MRDETLLGEIPPEVEVIRTGAVTSLLAPFASRRVDERANLHRSGAGQRRLRSISRWFMIPDPYVGWVPGATRAARAILARSGGVLMTTSSPDSAHLVGLRIPAVARREVAWVADFRDPWVRRMSFDPPSAAHRRIHESLEGKVVRRASRVITTSEATREDFLARYPDCEPRHFVVIPNGYDEDDFPREEGAADPSFVLLHVGQLNPERPVGPLLDCIETFLRIRPDARGVIRADLIGPHYLEDEREAVRRGLEGIVRFREGVPHREAVALLPRARVLLLLEQESDRGALILPGKIFEYLRAGRPILGLVPHGAAWDLITRLAAGACALPSDPSGGAAALAAIYDAWRRGDAVGSGADPIAIRAFERRALTARLAALLHEVDAEARPR